MVYNIQGKVLVIFTERTTDQVLHKFFLPAFEDLLTAEVYALGEENYPGRLPGHGKRCRYLGQHGRLQQQSGTRGNVQRHCRPVCPRCTDCWHGLCQCTRSSQSVWEDLHKVQARMLFCLLIFALENRFMSYLVTDADHIYCIFTDGLVSSVLQGNYGWTGVGALPATHSTATRTAMSATTVPGLTVARFCRPNQA